MKCIVYTGSDGNVRVCRPVYAERREDESEDEFIARIRQKDVPPHAKNVFICNTSDLPPRAQRSAWRQTGKGPPVVLDPQEPEQP